MNATDLRHRVSIQKRATNADGSPLQDRTGQEVISWITVVDAFAAIEPVSADEQTSSEAAMSVNRYTVTLRYRNLVTAKHRLLYQGKPLEILSVTDTDMRHHWIELACTAGQTQG